MFAKSTFIHSPKVVCLIKKNCKPLKESNGKLSALLVFLFFFFYKCSLTKWSLVSVSRMNTDECFQINMNSFIRPRLNMVKIIITWLCFPMLTKCGSTGEARKWHTELESLLCTISPLAFAQSVTTEPLSFWLCVEKYLGANIVSWFIVRQVYEHRTGHGHLTYPCPEFLHTFWLACAVAAKS